MFVQHTTRDAHWPSNVDAHINSLDTHTLHVRHTTHDAHCPGGSLLIRSITVDQSRGKFEQVPCHAVTRCPHEWCARLGLGLGLYRSGTTPTDLLYKAHAGLGFMFRCSYELVYTTIRFGSVHASILAKGELFFFSKSSQGNCVTGLRSKSHTCATSTHTPSERVDPVRSAF
jgi:hypothetical protein